MNALGDKSWSLSSSWLGRRLRALPQCVKRWAHSNPPTKVLQLLIEHGSRRP
jgi:hypothetical protein